MFQTEAWQKRQMNTQLASFTQLRHDTILYAKQACTDFAECEFPTGFVDPYPSFWQRMEDLADRTLTIACELELAFANHEYDVNRARSVFGSFLDVSRTLHGISVPQADKKPLTDEQTRFLKDIIDRDEGSGDPSCTGWYPSLFYTSGEDSCERDQLVADIHTNVPSELHRDSGGILHVGVGNVDLGFFVVDNVMYFGPVFSHYEFVTPIDKRLTDEEFSERLREFSVPAWARASFLVQTDPTFNERQARLDEAQWGGPEGLMQRWDLAQTMFGGSSDY